MAERARQYGDQTFLTVCNYEQVLRDILAIEAVKWGLIILDEGQRIKNWEAKTARIMKSLRSPFALVLSGTPLENRLDELYSVAEFIDDRRRVVDERGKVLGYKNLADLRQRLAPVLLRRTRAGVLSQLPPRTTDWSMCGWKVRCRSASVRIWSTASRRILPAASSSPPTPARPA